MVIFDIMVSHHKMTAWHDAALDQHVCALARLREAKRACHARVRDEAPPAKRLHSDPVVDSVAPLLMGYPSGSGGLIKAVSGRPEVYIYVCLLCIFSWRCVP